MTDKKMEKIRQQLNAMMTSAPMDKDKILEKSQELDLLILKSMKVQKLLRLGRIKFGDEAVNELESLLHKIMAFDKIYHSMRIVDPLAKKVMVLKEGELHELETSCYDYWKKRGFCENCISIRAYDQDDTIVKIEYRNDNIYFVTAMPVIINSRRLVVEFIKNATESLIANDKNLCGNMRIITMIEYLNQIAARDELSGLFNRKYINERLQIELLNAALKDEPLSILFAETEYIKNIGNTFGHEAGSLVLQELSRELRKQLRNDKAWLARYGESFIICLSNTDYGKAKLIAERIRKRIENKVFLTETQQVHITCSFGVYTFCDEDECLMMDHMLETAEKKMYHTEGEDRNCVV